MPDRERVHVRPETEKIITVRREARDVLSRVREDPRAAAREDPRAAAREDLTTEATTALEETRIAEGSAREPEETMGMWYLPRSLPRPPRTARENATEKIKIRKRI